MELRHREGLLIILIGFHFLAINIMYPQVVIAIFALVVLFFGSLLFLPDISHKKENTK